MTDSALEISTSSAGGIVVDRITKTYKGGKIKALNGLSLHIKEGEAFGLIGPNGAGKTTFFGCLLAFLRVDQGSITVDGAPPDAMKTRRHVGYLPERLNFDKWMTGREFLQYHHQLSGLPKGERLQTTDSLLARVGLKQEAWDLRIAKYSRGMLQRIGLAQALINDPKFLLLDEPASGVDPGGVLLVRSILRELKLKGTTIILNSHQLDQVEKVCDRVGFINAGQVEAIENLRTEEDTLKRVRVRWLATETTPEQSDLKRIVSEANGELLSAEACSALLALPSDERTAQAVKSLVLAGFEIYLCEAEENRLEKYFVSGLEAPKRESQS